MTWRVTKGKLPAGLSLAKSGVISGKPSQAGSFRVTLTVTDSSAPKVSASKQLTMTIKPIAIRPSLHSGGRGRGAGGGKEYSARSRLRRTKGEGEGGGGGGGRGRRSGCVSTANLDAHSGHDGDRAVVGAGQGRGGGGGGGGGGREEGEGGGGEGGRYCREASRAGTWHFSVG